jgi:D-amino peptidase
MEGVSGVVHGQQVDPNGCDYAFGLAMFKADLLACIEGLLEGGADHVVIYDEHYYGRNIDPAWLPKGVSVICGKPPYRADWAGGLDRNCAGVIMLGFHAKEGTPDALLAHTYEPDIKGLILNGQSVGEIGMEAAIAGDWNVPLLMLTADSEGVAECNAMGLGTLGVSVKQSMGTNAAEVYALSHSTQLIREAAIKAASGKVDARPFCVGKQVELEVHLYDNAYSQAVQELVPNDMKSETIVHLKGSSATAVWADYWQIKLRAQQRAEALK